MNEQQNPRLISLREWAVANGYSEAHVLRHLPYERDGFPKPEGTRRIKRIQVPEPVKLQGIKLDQDVTITRLLELIGVSEHRFRQVVNTHPDPLPEIVREEPAAGGGSGAPRQLRNLRALKDWWNARPGIVRGSVEEYLYDPDKLAPFAPPPRPEPITLPDQDLKAHVSLNKFATLIGVDGKTVSQYKQLDPDSMPSTVDGQRPDQLPRGARAKYVLGELLTWWNNRPGRVGRPVGYSPKNPKKKKTDTAGTTGEAK